MTDVSLPCWRRRLGVTGSLGAMVWRRIDMIAMWSWEGDAWVVASDGGGRQGGGLGLPRYGGSRRQSRCLAGVWVATWMETARAEGSST